MGHIYRELHEIPIPKDAYINHSDGRVFLMSDDGTNHIKRQVIGLATSDKTMHPNDNFKYLFPELWKQYYGGKELPEHELHLGMYAAALGIGIKTGLYPILQDCYGPLYGNGIMDYCMYSIMKRSNTTQLFYDNMVDQVKFSDETHEDGWFSNLFAKNMSANANHQFRIQWLKKCKENGVSKAWICIDGSNNDCQVAESELAEHGKAKSHTNSNIVSYIWAVSADDGLPLTYFVNNGGLVDSKAFNLIIEFLKSADIEVEGVILDRGFCTYDVVDALNKGKLPFVLMLKSDTNAHKEMIADYAEVIRWRVDHIVDKNGIFGVTDTKKIFKSHDETATIGLYFDGINGGERSVTLIKKILAAMQNAEDQIQNGEKPTVPKELSSYFSIVQIQKNKWTIAYNFDNWQKDIDLKGFYSIATTKKLSADELNRVYFLRDASEKQFMIMKTQLGFDTTRVHKDASIESKFAVCFAASILRSIMMNAAKKCNADTNCMIAKLNRIKLPLMIDGIYRFVDTISKKDEEFLSEFGIKKDYMNGFATDVNRRINNPINSQIHKLPDDPESPNARKPRGRPRKNKTEHTGDNQPKRKPGRPKGSKNKKTLEKEAQSINNVPEEKRKPGRPKGSKNKPKKRKPGRPKKNTNGSKTVASPKKKSDS